MKFQNRFVRLAAALAIVGIVVAQIPMRSTIAQAADGYGDSKGGLISLEGGSGIVLGGAVMSLVYGTVAKSGAAVAMGTSGGGTSLVAVLRSEPIYDLTDQKPEQFELVAKIIRNGQRVEDYRQNGKYTVFWPTNETLTRALGAERVKALQLAANQQKAKEFLASITVRGSYNLEALEDAAKCNKMLETLGGQTIVLTKEGETLRANGTTVLSTEYPASNGWVLATEGVVSSD